MEVTIVTEQSEMDEMNRVLGIAPANGFGDLRPRKAYICRKDGPSQFLAVDNRHAECECLAMRCATLAAAVGFLARLSRRPDSPDGLLRA